MLIMGPPNAVAPLRSVRPSGRLAVWPSGRPATSVVERLQQGVEFLDFDRGTELLETAAGGVSFVSRLRDSTLSGV